MPSIDTGRISLFFEDARSGGVPVLLLHELGGSSESWRAVTPPLAADRHVIAVDMRCRAVGEAARSFRAGRCRGRSGRVVARAESRRPGGRDRRGVGIAGRCAIRHPALVRRLMMCAVAPDMAGPTRTYLAKRAEKVRVVGMRGVAEASLANSFPASHPVERAAYSGFIWVMIRRLMPNCRWRWDGWR